MGFFNGKKLSLLFLFCVISLIFNEYFVNKTIYKMTGLDHNKDELFSLEHMTIEDNTTQTTSTRLQFAKELGIEPVILNILSAFPAVQASQTEDLEHQPVSINKSTAQSSETEINHQPVSINTPQINIPAFSPTGHIKKILLWDPLFANVDYGFGLGAIEPFITNNCSATSCELTNDRSQIATTDAVLFHTFKINASDIPQRGHMEQIYIFYNFENPLKNKEVLVGHGTRYNLTFTYLDSPDTDIHVPLGEIVPRHTWEPYHPPSLQSIYEKSRPVFWPVSNCFPDSVRIDYVNQLSKYIPVDTWGSCGKLKCPKARPFYCNSLWAKDYKFKLSFENGMCVDYITEKVFQALKYDYIPVVMGRPDYATKLPPKSYISVSDFDSPRALAEFLNRLHDHPEEYLEYFKWKHHSKSLSTTETRPRGFCKLCQILHDKSYQYKTNFNVEDYWSGDKLCIEGEEERQFVHI